MAWRINVSGTCERLSERKRLGFRGLKQGVPALMVKVTRTLVSPVSQNPTL